MRDRSLYIHIPFCRRKCPYCSFYSISYDEGLARAYVDVLLGKIEDIEGSVSTIYIGGGTPTVLHEGLLGKLLSGLKKFTGDNIEFTIEANPESLDREKLGLFLDRGVNRLSIGTQSFTDEKLQKLGRSHTAEEAAKAMDISRKAGFNNINIDLIFGVWGESVAEWKSELKKAVQSGARHISCYSLTYEENTALISAKNTGKILPLDEEVVAQMYGYTLDYLPGQGFGHYEVSNFAKKSHRCRHNLNYWDNNLYIGLGASAVSYLDGIRKTNVSDIKEYIKKVKAGEDPAASSEKLSDIDRAKETAAVKIRTKEGIDFRWFSEKTGFDFCGLEKDVLPVLVEKGLIEYKKENKHCPGTQLTKKGFLFSDTVSSELL
ncbi:MAG: radical SAM family heme chaperone HemW [Candidatus Omnitrophota bacterium]|nr:radical SAM family heme chaperone HemW [Candidatus Omnitrophota bacterium]